MTAAKPRGATIATPPAPVDSSHLIAILERLSRERARLAADPGNALLQVWVAQSERELAGEYRFLGLDPAPPAPTLTDDELLAALGDAP